MRVAAAMAAKRVGGVPQPMWVISHCCCGASRLSKTQKHKILRMGGPKMSIN